MSMSSAAKVVDSNWQGNEVTFSGISIDSRTIEKDQLFIALKGDNFDGHQFVSVAEKNGATAVMVSEDVDTELPVLKVTDTLAGLQSLASNWRDRFNLPLVAITGSNGKTTVKELVGSILKVHCNDVLVTRGNLNNHIGVPLTLLRLNETHRCAVVEMGMNHAGEISLLTQLAKPAVALVNNAMSAHVEAFDSITDVAFAKSEIFQGLSADGIAVLNADDPNYELFKQQIGTRKFIDFALRSSANVTANLNQIKDQTNLSINTPKGKFDCKLNLPGHHNVMNALAAVATTLALDVDLVSIKQGIENVMPVEGRLQPIKLSDSIFILNDTYNANPDSMKAGIDVLAQHPGEKKILVVGDMGELGDQSAQLHRQIGEYAAQMQIDSFLSLGPLMRQAAEAFGGCSFNTQHIDELIERLLSEMESDCAVLIKGSRSMRMERVVEVLTASTQRGQQ